MMQLKNTLFDMMREDKKLNDEAIKASRSEIDQKIDKVESQVK